MVAPRCQHLLAEGKPCRAFARRGKPFCLHHDPELAEKRAARNAAGAAATNAAKVPADHHLDEDEVSVPGSRSELRDLLARTIRDVLIGRLDARRGKVVQDLGRQLVPLLAVENEAEKERAAKSDLTDEELLVELLREAEIVRARIAARAGGNGKGIDHGTAAARR